MGRASLESLPVELHTIIMKDLLSSCRPFVQPPVDVYHLLHGAPQGRPEVQEWIEKDLRSPSLFPYNVASAWSLWHDILKRMPECWTRVVFDVAEDPAPFLGAFTWSKNATHIEVVVYNSSRIGDMRPAGEVQRMKTIFQALSVHIPRCKSIIFNSSFSSSLPAPNVFLLQEAPYLEELTLECCVDNIDLSKVPPTTPQWQQQVSFPRLEKLSLTGFWFMYLIQHAHSGSSWLQKLKLGQYFSIHISRFVFPRSGNYSLETFMQYLSVLQTDRGSLDLRDLSLSFPLDSSIRHPEPCYKIAYEFYFQSVSKSFLSLFNFLREKQCYSGETMMFEKCALPVGLDRLGQAIDLTLKSIISDADDGHNAGLRSVIECCCDSELTVSDCPSFGDDDLRWLGTPQECVVLNHNGREKVYRRFPASEMTSLSIRGCPNVSPRAVVTFVKNRHDASLIDDLPEDNLREVHVTGKGLVHLTKEDKEAFLEVARSLDVQLSWTVEEEDGGSCRFLAWMLD